MFDVPWYECEGPTTNDVRNDLTRKYKNGEHAENEYLEKIYQNNLFDSHNVIHEIINEKITSNMDFGSWRGYATFGIEEAVLKNINSHINRKIYAIILLRKKFIPYVNHYLYNP